MQGSVGRWRNRGDACGSKRGITPRGTRMLWTLGRQSACLGLRHRLTTRGWLGARCSGEVGANFAAMRATAHTGGISGQHEQKPCAAAMELRVRPGSFLLTTPHGVQPVLIEPWAVAVAGPCQQAVKCRVATGAQTRKGGETPRREAKPTTDDGALTYGCGDAIAAAG